jgi:hypothetical protein
MAASLGSACRWLPDGNGRRSGNVDTIEGPSRVSTGARSGGACCGSPFRGRGRRRRCTQHQLSRVQDDAQTLRRGGAHRPTAGGLPGRAVRSRLNRKSARWSWQAVVAPARSALECGVNRRFGCNLDVGWWVSLIFESTLQADIKIRCNVEHDPRPARYRSRFCKSDRRGTTGGATSHWR